MDKIDKEKSKTYKFENDENMARFSQSYINSLRLFLQNDSFQNKVTKIPQSSCQMIAKLEKKQNKEE